MKNNINYLMNKVHVCDTDSRELNEDDWEEILSKDSEALADKVDEIYRFYARSPEGWGESGNSFRSVLHGRKVDHYVRLGGYHRLGLSG